MKASFVPACTIAALLFCHSIASAQPAPSAAGPAVIVAGHYFDYRVATCNNTTQCSLLFLAVPSGKKLNVTRVSCSITVLSPSASKRQIETVTIGSRLSNQNIAVRGHFLGPVTSMSDDGTSTTYGLNSETFSLAEAQEQPAVTVATSSTAVTRISFSCHISGDIS
jgi:hypothetical protein